jgi:hypothetical protein
MIQVLRNKSLKEIIMKTNIIYSTNVLKRGLRFIGTMTTLALVIPIVAFSQYSNPDPVPLLTAGTYGALAYSGITGSANINGDIGTSTASIDATIIQSGTNWGVGGDHNSQAQSDLGLALTDANNRTNDATITGDALGGLILGRGVYGGGALDLASGTTITLNGSATDVFIIKAASSLTINANSTVSLTGGAVWSNVFWYVGSSSTNISGSTFKGIILAQVSITLNGGAVSVYGRLLSHTGAVTVNSDVLPVELTSFTAVLKNNKVELNWNTATEINNYGFEIERTSTSLVTEWKKVGFVKGNGNSNSPQNYMFIDNTISYGSYSYRLKQIDNDGNFEYSNIIEVNVGQIPDGFFLNQNYPNPFNPLTQIQFGISTNTYVTLTVFNALGEKVLTPFNSNVRADQVYNVTINGENLTSGIYYYILQANEKTEVKKMLLLK